MKFVYTIITIILFTGCIQKQTQFTVIKEANKKGVINQSGYVIVKPIYKEIFNFDGNDDFMNHPHYLNLHWINYESNKAYAIVQNVNNKYGVINQEGKLLLKPIYDSITYFFEGFMRIQIGKKYGLVNENFEVVLKPTYDEIHEFVEKIALVKNDNKWGCINKDIKVKIKPTYDKIYLQQEDFLRTTLNNKWGYLDNKCNIVSNPTYDYAYNFSNGIAKIVIKNNIGYIDQNGDLLSKTIFKENSSSF